MFGHIGNTIELGSFHSMQCPYLENWTHSTPLCTRFVSLTQAGKLNMSVLCRKLRFNPGPTQSTHRCQSVKCVTCLPEQLLPMFPVCTLEGEGTMRSSEGTRAGISLRGTLHGLSQHYKLLPLPGGEGRGEGGLPPRKPISGLFPELRKACPIPGNANSPG